MKRKNRETDSFSVSFLDVAACGFGAIIILLVITSSASITPEYVDLKDPEGSIEELQEQLFAIRGETTIYNRDLNAKNEQLSAVKERIARLRRDLSEVQGKYAASNQLSDEATDEIGALSLAQQSMTEEMQKLLADQAAVENEYNPIGGIPIDSEYVIFIIDTSGSMQSIWAEVTAFVETVLNVYPEVKGMQVMNTEGQYMFNSYAREWIEDTPALRKQVLAALRLWRPFSRSTPVRGIIRAIQTFHVAGDGKKIGLFVLGDDFQSDETVNQVLYQVRNVNRVDENGEGLVRIHTIGFTPMWDQARAYGGREDFKESVRRFSTLMREIANQNGGAFVGIAGER